MGDGLELRNAMGMYPAVGVMGGLFSVHNKRKNTPNCWVLGI